MKNEWIRCIDCGRKVHHKKVWDSKSNKFVDTDDIDKDHRCNVCEHIKMRGGIIAYPREF
jgi:hypothetical protein